MEPLLSIVIPVFNEEGVIADNIDEVAEYLVGYLKAGESFELIVVDDGSVDATSTLLGSMREGRPWLRVERHAANRGRGRALRTGFEAARGEYVVTLDADLSYAPEHIGAMLAPLRAQRADLVLASAYHPAGSVANVPRLRALTSRWGNRLLATGMPAGIHTVTCVARAYRREVVKSLELKSDGKGIHLEIIQKALLLGFRVVEVPAALAWRAHKRTRGGKRLRAGALAHMISDHLFFNFLFRPALLLHLPILFLLAVVVYVLVCLGQAYVDILRSMPPGLETGAYLLQSLRRLVFQASIHFFGLAFAAVLLFNFLSLAFLSKQSKHYFGELYVLLSRMNERLKRLEEKR